MSDFHFDQRAVDSAIAFFERVLVLTKSTPSESPEAFRMMPHTRQLLTDLFGWKRPDGTQRYRRVFLTVGRKNAKTQICAGLGLYFLLSNKTMSPEIYVAAKDRDQASILYDAAADMVAAQPALAARLVATTSHKTIRNRANRGILKALSSEGASKHGKNPSVVIMDELHAWGPSEQELYAALTTGSVARKDPLRITITTAGYDRESICYAEYDYAKKVLAGTIKDDRLLPLIYEVPMDADWTDESLWPLANPGLGTTVQLEHLRDMAAQAKFRPLIANDFRRLHLNQWTQQATTWLPMQQWDACGWDFDESLVAGVPCYGGVDLGSTSDLTSFSLVWPIGAEVYQRSWFWIPRDGIAERSHRDGVPYGQWAENGHVELTDGQITNWIHVTERIEQICRQYSVRQIAFDRYGARDFASRLQDGGLEVIDYGQGYVSMNAPCRRLEELVSERKLRHDGNPVLRWNADCAEVTSDPAGNIKIVKPKRLYSTKRVDGLVALAMSLGISLTAAPSPTYFWMPGENQ